MSVRASLQSHLSDFQGHKLDWPQFLARLTELLARELTCDRVSVWRLSPSRDQLVCENLYLAGPRLHRQGEALARSRFPNYFWCLEESRVIVAPEARTHPGTSCLHEDYLAPGDIHSLLDSAILRKGAVEGLLRCEQVGQSRPWSPSDLLTVRMATILVGSARL
ncbi:hypothetical protein GETHLI_30680 [Geothrix limicola]|uniref:GAF domain-containing protein n=1 Tax=Geothrix limicola TaxID=2927978 RepID=A0ABQ5QJ26_9BACT|nr:GAF domain-containing protein [Geothrix limicola]GLH74566.1 hypothetical protein GETHLI_30680 [Geothrix limicola]